ncbi:MAG: glycoside hydrolase family 9 protein [bacterium]
MRIAYTLFLFLLSAVGCRQNASQPSVDLKLVNLSHLNHLYEEVVIDGKEMALIHIYSEYPDYGWVDAHNEGIACVDDVARAAVVYLRHFEITGDSASLKHARKLLEFCRYMQAEDGQFYNFIYTDGSINRNGKTSFKSFGWWAARAVWALGEGVRVYQKQDTAYAETLKRHLHKTYAHIDTVLAHYPEAETFNGFTVPKWLLYNSAADATSELMLGLAALAEASNDSRAKNYLETFADGLIQMQIGAEETLPFGALLSWKNIWHGWANSQTQALARLSRVLGKNRFRNAAIKEASFFYPYWMEQGFPRELDFVLADTIRVQRIDKFDQIAYAIRPAVVGSLKLYELTQQERFAELAGDLATWFFGNNPANKQMYDPENGRCFDGILSETEINRNSGAESTIEALYSILEVEANPVARARLENFLVSDRKLRN